MCRRQSWRPCPRSADGLDLVRRILAGAGRHLTPTGLLVVEVGDGAERLEAAFPRVPFQWVALEQGGEGVFVLDAAECMRLAGRAL